MHKVTQERDYLLRRDYSGERLFTVVLHCRVRVELVITDEASNPLLGQRLLSSANLQSVLRL